MKFKPMHDRILIKRIGEVSSGGIALPTDGQRPVFAVVCAVGDGTRFQTGELNPVRVAPGQKIVLERPCGVPLRIDGDEYLMIREAEVMGVFEEEKSQSATLSVVN